MSDIKLKPCPFCGATEESGMVYVTDNIVVSNIHTYGVECKICNAKIESKYAAWSQCELGARQHWNRRVQNEID